MFLTNKDMLDLVELRHDLHRHPEISGRKRRPLGASALSLRRQNPTGFSPILAAMAWRRSMTAVKAARRS